ncbi:MAG: NADH-quinone oxidoreductase subunit L, partial [Verrucomicrobiae bacterium]|nr:NADH-quinone oxidoreductase subunit L [Verrucomicrobiae bacterium]
MPCGFWWLLLLLPLGSAMLIAAALRPYRAASAAVSVASAAACFAVAVWGIASGAGAPEALAWLRAGDWVVPVGMLLDPLASVMLLVVTGVGFLIHVFSLGYMSDDPGRSRFFGGLSLFMFSMTGIVVSDNLVMTFMFWELVGVSSYLLIGFWFERPSAAAAATKAFVVNRIGDFGFLLGILAVWGTLGQLGFAPLREKIEAGALDTAPWAAVFLMAAGLFCGAVGKSAQVPLHVWLPDAMEGPTPVSALIHAATMVAAGVYFLCRVFFLIEMSLPALDLIAWTGGATALIAALIAVRQDDIKRVLAYSTVSQLGYMVMAVGLAAPSAAMFHLCTHAFFKALLFLAAGSVIHALHHEQDIWKMGGLRSSMPVTFWTFLAGALALAGCPGLSGFFSKEAILAAAHEAGSPLFWLGLLTASLTAFYMARVALVAFWGTGRERRAREAHESPAVMVVPLIVLAALSIAGGWLGIEGALHGEPLAAEGEGHGWV